MNGKPANTPRQSISDPKLRFLSRSGSFKVARAGRFVWLDVQLQARPFVASIIASVICHFCKQYDERQDVRFSESAEARYSTSGIRNY